MNFLIANPAAAYMQGEQFATQSNEMKRQRGLNNVFAEHGAGIAAGDPAALNALAQYDPMAVYGMRRQQEADARAEELFNIKVAEYKAGISAEEAAAQAALIKRGVFAASGAETPEQWDAIVAQFGANDLVGQFDNRDALLRQYMTAAQNLEADAGPQPLSSPGKVYADIQAGLLPEGTELRSPSVVVNTGDQTGPRPIVDKPPKGFQRVWDDQAGTYIDKPIPGSEVETERSGDARKVELANSAYRRKSDIVNSNLDKAVKQLESDGRWVAGFGSLLSGLPESAARDFQATLDTVKANLGFEELQAMRDASPTGGALGQVSEREIAFLQAIQGNLDAAQSPEQLLEVLKEIKKRREEFAAEREAIMAQNFTATTAADLQTRINNMPNFSNMTDEQLDAWIEENGQ